MLYVGQTVLVAEKNNGGKWCNATVIDIYDNEILISLPRTRAAAARLPDDALLEVSFLEGAVRYIFESTLCARHGRNTLAIRQPLRLEKTDLRQYPRVQADLEVFYTEVDSGKPADYKKGYLLDISGNGMRFSTDQPYTPGTLMSVRFNLPGDDGAVPVKMEVRVVRVVVDDQKEPVEYQLGLGYSRIEKADRDLIVDYVRNRLNRGRDCQKG